MDYFAQILFDLGQEIGVELYPDENRICQVNFEERLAIQIHHNEPKEQLILASFLCEVPAGKYRENLFRAALIHNSDINRMGTLGYCERNNQLTFFYTIATEQLKSHTLFTLLEAFIKKATLWKEAVETAKPLPILLPKEKGGPMFGLTK